MQSCSCFLEVYKWIKAWEHAVFLFLMEILIRSLVLRILHSVVSWSLNWIDSKK